MIRNKVKYQGETLVNTCETFQADIKKVVESNNLPDLLAISACDNSEYSYYYLEPGQYELKADSLYFRLKNDLHYPKQQYLGSCQDCGRNRLRTCHVHQPERPNRGATAHFPVRVQPQDTE